MEGQGRSGRQSWPGQGIDQAEVGVVAGVARTQQGEENVPATPQIGLIRGDGPRRGEPEPDRGHA